MSNDKATYKRRFKVIKKKNELKITKISIGEATAKRWSKSGCHAWTMH